MTLAHRIGPLFGLVAPSGSARRRLLRFGYRAWRSLPKLRSRRYLATKLAEFGDCISLQLLMLSCRDPLSRARLKSAGHCRWRKILGSLAFAAVDQPRVSIIIPVYNQFWKTLECLQSIGASPGGPGFEVIVIDDRSTDRTSRVLSTVPGLITLRNEQRLGAIASFNRGAVHARGKYIVFLDQDALATPGWLAALDQTFCDIPGTGLSGSKLVRPDGRLLEAGAVIWRDASLCAYGESDDADHPWYNFAREVDYCTAGCLMLPRDLFLELGGFDPAQVAPLCDADLALRIRHSGHRVIYQPTTRVIQHARASTTAQASSELKLSEQTLLQPFRERWRERLDSHPEPPRGLVRLVRPNHARQAALGQVLVIDHRIPTPDRDSGSFRMIEIIRAIKRRGHHVTFIPDNMVVFSPYLEDLQRVGVEVIHPPFYESIEEYLIDHGRDLSLVIISRADVAQKHMETTRRHAPNARIVFDTVDLHFVRETRQGRFVAEKPQVGTFAGSRKEQELRLARKADLTLVVSPFEKAVIDEETSQKLDVRILSNIHPIIERAHPGYEERRDIVFIGGFDHAPNVDAVLYFARDIFSRIRDRIPAATFQVIGPEPTPEIARLASASIQILGFVPDVEPIFDRARVSVAPLRFGAGVKGKVNQSMSFGVPTVVTSIAAEGMYLTHGENAMIADLPEAFADAVVLLWTSPELWQKVARNGIQNLIDHFSVEAASKPIDELLTWAGLSTSPIQWRGSPR